MILDRPTSDPALVLFDWNGTIVTDRDRARSALNEVLRARRLPVIGAAEFSTTFTLPMTDMFRRLAVADPARAEQDWNEAMITRPTEARSGVAVALRALTAAGVRIGVVSAASLASVITDQESLGLAGLWDSVTAPVRDKIAVLRAERRGSRTAIYVGDTCYDMQAARSAGYLPVGVTGGYATVDDLAAAGAAVIIDDLRELIDILAAEGVRRRR